MAEIPSGVAVRKAIDVTGIVQGVGFRPFVYRLAHDCHLAGFIANTPAGVTIEIQGDDALVESFLQRLQSEAPPLARITSLTPYEVDPQPGDATFRILSSRFDSPP